MRISDWSSDVCSADLSCRAGSEPVLAAELTARAGEAGFAGYARTERGSGFVVFACDEPDALSRALPWRGLVFARQKLRILAELRGLDTKDRITPIKAALQMEEAVDGAQVAGKAAPYGALLVESSEEHTSELQSLMRN